MNLMLPIVVSEIPGVSGLKILHAILAGVRDPQPVPEFRTFTADLQRPPRRR
jgi:hypothetical protein